MTTDQSTIKPHGVSIRKIPYPYRAMLAICSDLDETPGQHVYRETMRFLNTTGPTVMGPGLGLEVGNTIYFDMPLDQFSYWNTDDKGREMIRALIHSGHIDCLHSFGDLAVTRTHAEKALNELNKHDCCLKVWIDHGIAPSNFGADIMCGNGDITGSKVYHADITCDYGIQYVCCGRVTSVIGQNVPRSYSGIWNSMHPLASAVTLSKEYAKNIMANKDSSKYPIHRNNHLMRESRLRSGQEVVEFIRSNPHWGGVSCGETSEGIAGVLTRRILDRLVDSQGVCVLYTHLGKIKNKDKIFNTHTRKALNLLAEYLRNGKILVTTTRRLLDYCRAIHKVGFSVSMEVDYLKVDVASNGCEDLGGLSIYTPDPVKTRVTINGSEVEDIHRNGVDNTGRLSVSIPWKPLVFPKL